MGGERAGQETGAEARQRLEAPGQEVAEEHHVVAAVHGGVGLVAVPQLPDGSGAVLHHVAPRRIAPLRGNGPCHVAVATVAERAQQPRDADDTAGHVALVLHHDVLHYLLRHLVGQRVGHDAKSQRQHVGRRRVVIIEIAVRIERMTGTRTAAHGHVQETAVEGVGHDFAALLPVEGIVAQVEQAGKLPQQLQATNHIGRGDERAVGLPGGVLAVNEVEPFGRHAPVAVLVLRDEVAAHVLLEHVQRPALHRRIAVADGLRIAIAVPEHLTGEGQGGRPGDVVGIVVPEGRCHVGDDAVGALRLADVAHPFCIEPLIVKKVALAQRAHGAVAQPGLALVALRTVEGHALVVVDDAPPGVLHHAGERRIRTGEMPRAAHGVGHEVGLEVRCLSRHLDVAEAMPHEGRVPLAVLLATDEDVL